MGRRRPLDIFLGCVLVRVEREQLVQALGAQTLEEAGGERLLLGYSGSERDQQTAKRFMGTVWKKRGGRERRRELAASL